MFETLKSKLNLRRLDKNPIPARPEIRLFAKLRNERIRIPYFLEYYRKLGVDRFFLIDNNSDDGSREYLLEQNDVHTYLTKESLKKHAIWLNILLNRYGRGNWNLAVDLDEFLVYKNIDSVDLKAFTAKLEDEKSTQFNTVTIDMYSDEVLPEYREGEDPLQHCPYFDYDLKSAHYRTITMEHPRHPRLGGIEIERALQGGVRNRVYGMWPMLNGATLFQYTDITRLSGGNHSMRNATKLSDQVGCLLHFKFLQDFEQKVKTANREKQYWGDSAEYRSYAEKKPTSFFSTEHSKKYTGWKQINELGFIQ